MIYLKLHNTDNGDILAMCDSTLIEKVLSEDDLEINIRDYSDFYKGQLLDRKAADPLIKREKVYCANIVGKESVDLALEKGIIEKGNIKRIMKVPYANAFRIIK